ncbi:hypothetical protein DCO58_02300 [Helicobacter saguini]|uniref:Uncharacterized protein n=1 Tax=Helicobacter saguini TaxID=1548018 RepID=A0A347VRS5_9HELI|nr:hypothetical protein [Helicobacter saguini]MWV62793.1 hypothetical protein [Helicobacter saguini]MWV66538.1 hypothetical protein [Helicobacter saguini]MWV68887.1 hypothetical protein [Helicobacter saguini]MWV71559.1 hypothetical protein [Helicobacter saguini]TLD93652.1 hypothetical protein LS64_008475 [Helicobacter saguini]
MKLIELIFSILIIAILSCGAFLSYSLALPNNTRSTLTTLYALKHTRILSLADSTYLGFLEFGDIYNFARVDSARLLQNTQNFLWQTQFHTSGIYTKNSLSIYRDTPRFASSTDFDRRPLAGDIVALNVGNSQCLSGYNNSNITGFCKDNAAFDFRLFESNRLDLLSLGAMSSCVERDTFRFYFSDFGSILCGNNIHTPLSQQIRVGDSIIMLENLSGYAFILH